VCVHQAAVWCCTYSSALEVCDGMGICRSFGGAIASDPYKSKPRFDAGLPAGHARRCRGWTSATIHIGDANAAAFSPHHTALLLMKVIDLDHNRMSTDGANGPGPHHMALSLLQCLHLRLNAIALSPPPCSDPNSRFWAPVVTAEAGPAGHSHRCRPHCCRCPHFVALSLM
jgi:hypothetical protein